jgi:hypothetical protein
MEVVMESGKVALTREQILQARDMKLEAVEVPEWGGTLYVRTMKARDRDAFEASRVRLSAENKPEIVSINTRARLLSMTVCDDKGVLLFLEEDIELLGEKNAGAMDQVYEVALRINAMRNQDLEKKLKNS